MKVRQSDEPDEGIALPAACVVHGFGYRWAVVFGCTEKGIYATCYGRDQEADKEAEDFGVNLARIVEAIQESAKAAKEEGPPPPAATEGKP